MKKNSFLLAIVAASLFTAQSALSDTQIPIGPKYATGESDFENGFLYFQVNGLTGPMRDAQKQAMEYAQDNAIDAFKSACSHRGGEPSKVKAYPGMGGCNYTYTGRQGTFRCSAKATGVCTVVSKASPKTSDRLAVKPAEAPKEVVIDGKVYVEKSTEAPASAPAAN